MVADFKTFHSCNDVAAFLTELGRDRIIAVHELVSQQRTLIVWFWKNA